MSVGKGPLKIEVGCNDRTQCTGIVTLVSYVQRNLTRRTWKSLAVVDASYQPVGGRLLMLCEDIWLSCMRLYV